MDRARPRFQTYLEVDLPALLERIAVPDARLPFDVHGPELDLFLRFFLFFSAHGFRQIQSRTPLVRRAVEGSSEHALGVSEELKERVFEALRLSIEGLVTFAPNQLNPATDLEICQENSFVFLYRLLFILYAEDRSSSRIPRMTRTQKTDLLLDSGSEVATELDLMRRGA